MPITPIPTLANVGVVNPVTPFTYRDNATYLTILHGLEKFVEQLAAHVNEQDAENHSAWAQAMSDLTNQLNLTILSMYNDLETQIADTHEDALADDPTTGARNAGLSRVVGNVYDNTRIFAYFAGQYDAVGMTAAEYDALNYSARHFDLAPLYPTLNDVYPAGS